MSQSTKCITPKFRVSYPEVFKPKGFQDQEPKFSVQMIFDKTTDLKPLKDAIIAAIEKEWGPKANGKWPKNMRLPIRDGAEKPDAPELDGKIFVTAKSKQRPGVIDQAKSPITEEDGAFYAGCYARASLNAYAYEVLGNKGVAFGLNNLQKLADGEAFGGRTNAASDFDAVEDTSENAESYGESNDDLFG